MSQQHPAGADHAVYGVIGSGLIGGSVVTRLLNDGRPVVVCDTDAATRCAVRDLGAQLVETPEQVAAHADLIVIAVAPRATADVWRRIAGAAGARTRPGRLLVIDVASTKAPILADHDLVWSTDAACLSLTHPMAGKEQSGWVEATPDLFERAAWLVCPHPELLGRELLAIVELCRAMGARPVMFDAQRHDRFAALVSHLPHLIAFCFRELLEDVDPGGTWHRFSGGSLADMLRVADADPRLWVEILAANADELAWATGALVDRMQKGWQPVDPTAPQRPVAELFAPGPAAGSVGSSDEVRDVGDGLSASVEHTVQVDEPLGGLAGVLAASGHEGYEIVDIVRPARDASAAPRTAARRNRQGAHPAATDAVVVLGRRKVG